ncbi:glycosyltransferase [Pseudarthrobacter siccitolerans]|uniref:glycosyltransferase n=1 Tax=Pseudarthrobacter siccitolerans TaxID=861266 RepID=UPI000AA06BF2|nr:glycosyltransferase family 2 protein [Pseudarthrobacter siccitolerans]
MISVVIVTYNSAHVIGDCLRALVPAAELEIIVVDNASRDETLDIVRAEFPAVIIIRNRENRGFAKAVNLGAESASGDVILLLNPDATIAYENVLSLSASLLADTGLAVIAPVLSDGAGEFRTVSAGMAPTLRNMLNHSAGLSRFGGVIPLFRGHYLLSKDLRAESVDVDWVSGGCLMVKRDDWEAVNGLTERWFMYAEDIEFCMRIRERGRRIRIQPNLLASHSIGGSSSNVDGRVNTLWIENLFDLYCWRLSRSRFDRELWRLVVSGGFFARAAFYKLRSLRHGRTLRESTPESAKYFKFAYALLRSKAATETVGSSSPR